MAATMDRFREFTRISGEMAPCIDFISNMPANVTDMILKQLPLATVAKTSILSRTWRRIWLSCPYLVFDGTFWGEFCKVDKSFDWQKGSDIISGILCHHNSRIHSIHILLSPDNPYLIVKKHVSLSSWLSLLSRTCPKEITLLNSAGEWTNLVVMPSYIFRCTDVMILKLQCFALNAPPFEFKGFPHLRNLELCSMKFNRGIDMLWSLVAKCPCLVLLKLENCLGMDILDIDAPTLETLIIRGSFDSLRLKKAPCLIDLEMCSTKPNMNGVKTVVATVNSLANSCQLQCLAIDGNLLQFLPEGGMNKSLPVALNHLNWLCLTNLDLSGFDVFCFTLGMVQSCPFIKELEISFISARGALHHKYENCSQDFKLGCLKKATMTGITGSSAELKLIEYVLSVSVVLEKLFFRCQKLDAFAELKVLEQLLCLPRASTKAQLIRLEE